MHIKKFIGSTAKEALQLIKSEFGDNALILSNKRVDTGLYEVVAAVDYDLTEPATINIATGTYGGGVKGNGATGGGGGASGEGKAVNLQAKNAAEADQITEIRKELQELRELKDLCSIFASNSNTPASLIFTTLEKEFIRNGIDRRLAQKVLTNTFKAISDKAPDINSVKSYMKKKMFEKISVSDPLSENGVVAFVGPAGVGKTTTVAKLAAVHALKKKKKIALITMDTYRIAASEQLKVYGKIIGVPVEVAKNAAELKTFMDAHSDKDLVLVDTAGRSRYNAVHMNELMDMAALNTRIKFNLVLSCQTRDEVLYDCVRGFGAVALDSLTFTRLDEGEVYGPVLNTMMMSNKPVSYLAAGQRVPEDIEVATRERLLNFFMPN